MISQQKTDARSSIWTFDRCSLDVDAGKKEGRGKILQRVSIMRASGQRRKTKGSDLFDLRPTKKISLARINAESKFSCP